MPVLFDITYQSSPYAIFGGLYYRHVLPDGTYSTWTFASTYGPFVINTSGGTVTTHTLNDVVGNPPEFFPGTTYQFYIDQQCSNNVVEPSPISDDIWIPACPEFIANLTVDYDDNASSYAIQISLYDPAGPGAPMNPLAYSIANYNFTVYELLNTGPVNIGTITVPYSNIEAILPATQYTLLITSGDLVNPIVAGITYQINMSIDLTTSTQIETYECPNAVNLLVSECDTFKITTGKTWAIEYLDCNGQVRKFAGTAPVPPFYICAKQIPKGYWCLNGVQKAPVNTTGGVIHAIGSCISTAITGILDQGAVITCAPGPGCDSAYNQPYPTNIQNQITLNTWNTVITSVQC